MPADPYFPAHHGSHYWRACYLQTAVDSGRGRLPHSFRRDGRVLQVEVTRESPRSIENIISGC